MIDKIQLTIGQVFEITKDSLTTKCPVIFIPKGMADFKIIRKKKRCENKDRYLGGYQPNPSLSSGFPMPACKPPKKR
jgi:hypothetical protein